MNGNSDGSVIIKVNIPTSEAEKEIQKLTKKIIGMERALQMNEDKKLPLIKQLDSLTIAADEAASKLDKMQNAPIGTYTKTQIAEQEETVQALGARWDAVSREVVAYDRKIANITEKLNAAKEQYGELVIAQQQAEAEQKKAGSEQEWNQRMEQVEAKAKEIAGRMGEAFKSVGSVVGSVVKGAANSIKKLASGIIAATKKLNVFSRLSEKLNGIMKKLGRTIKSALVFSVIYKGLSLVKEQVASYLTANDELSAALSRIKGALLTAFQPIYDAVVPALTTLLDVLTRIVSVVAQFTSSLFGTTAKQAQENANALYEQAKATKEASTALASFDEINKLSDNSAAEIAPTFELTLDDTKFDSWGKSLDAFLNKILNNGIPLINSAFEAISEKVNSFSDKILEMFSFPGLAEKVSSVGEQVAFALNNLAASIEWNELGKAIGTGIHTALVFGASFLSAINWSELGVSLANSINGIVSRIDWHNLGMLLFSGFGIAIETLAGLLIGLDMTEIGQAASNLAIGFFDSITDTLSGIDWVEIGHQVKEFLVNIDWGGVASSVFTAIGSAFGALTGSLWGFIKDAWKEVVNWWRDVAYEDGEFTLTGLLDGMWDSIKSIGTWIKEHIFQPFIDGFKKVFGIHSPSTVMKEQGNFIMDGLLNGISEKIGAVIEAAEEVFDGIISFVGNVFSGDWELAWDSISGVFKNIWNGIIGTLEGAVNLIIKGINWLIKQLNKVSFSIPDWVPSIGGKKFGFDIPSVSQISIPRLATGTVVPPNREFLAVLGDNKTETEIVSPLSTMKQAFLEAMQESGGMSSGTVEVKLYLDGQQIAKNQVKHINDMTKQAGKSVLLV